MARSLSPKNKEWRRELSRKAIQEIATRIIQIRNSKGLTQGQLAELTKLSQPAISQIESGKVVPEMETLIVFANKMQEPLNNFFPPTIPNSLFGDSILGLLWLRIHYWWIRRQRNKSGNQESE